MRQENSISLKGGSVLKRGKNDDIRDLVKRYLLDSIQLNN